MGHIPYGSGITAQQHLYLKIPHFLQPAGCAGNLWQSSQTQTQLLAGSPQHCLCTITSDVHWELGVWQSQHTTAVPQTLSHPFLALFPHTGALSKTLCIWTHPQCFLCLLQQGCALSAHIAQQNPIPLHWGILKTIQAPKLSDISMQPRLCNHHALVIQGRMAPLHNPPCSVIYKVLMQNSIKLQCLSLEFSLIFILLFCLPGLFPPLFNRKVFKQLFQVLIRLVLKEEGRWLMNIPVHLKQVWGSSEISCWLK